MKEFIAELFDNEIPFHYSNYDTYFVKEKFNTYYLFFFLKEENQLIELKEQTGELYQAIKRSRDVYEEDMDKNTTCIYCLCVEDDIYYQTESTGTISELSKKICLVEEDLEYFKKNVLIYTQDMKRYADENIGQFETLCNEMITDENFRAFRELNKQNYQYDFLVNLFIKLPFLNFQNYQIKKSAEYQTLENLIGEECKSREIDLDDIKKDIDLLEKFNTWHGQLKEVKVR